MDRKDSSCKVQILAAVNRPVDEQVGVYRGADTWKQGILSLMGFETDEKIGGRPCLKR